MPSQGGWSPDIDTQPANTGWDDEAPPHVTAAASRGRGRGRASSSGGRPGSVVQAIPMQRSGKAALDRWGGDPSGSQAGQVHDGWGDAVAPEPQGQSHLLA